MSILLLDLIETHTATQYYQYAAERGKQSAELRTIRNGEQSNGKYFFESMQSVQAIWSEVHSGGRVGGARVLRYSLTIESAYTGQPEAIFA